VKDLPAGLSNSLTDLKDLPVGSFPFLMQGLLNFLEFSGKNSIWYVG